MACKTSNIYQLAQWWAEKWTPKDVQVLIPKSSPEGESSLDYYMGPRESQGPYERETGGSESEQQI